MYFIKMFEDTKIKLSGGEYVSDDDKIIEDSFIGQKFEALNPFCIRLEPFRDA